MNKRPQNPNREKPGRLFIPAACLLAALIFVSFWPALHAEFITLDDTPYVTGNGIVQKGITLDGLFWAFTTFYQANWHPLTWLSHMLDCQIYGLNPVGHHLSSLLLHAANAILLLWILGRTTGSLSRSFAAAAIFALHPLRVESVAWVAERKDVLSAFFGFLALLAYIRYVEKPGIRRYTIILLAFALGLMAKPMLVTLPFVFLLLDYWPLRRLGMESMKARAGTIPWQTAGALVREKIPLFILAAASSIVTYWAQAKGGAAAQFEDLSLGVRFENALVSYVKYVWKFLVPHGLAPFYPHPGDTIPSWQAVLAGIFLISVSLVVLRMHWRNASAPMGWCWYLGTLIPVMGLVQVGAQAMADRYTYVPMIGLAIAVVWALPDRFIDGLGARKPGSIAALAALVLCLAVLTYHQAGYWRNSIRLFQHTYDVAGSSYVIHSNLGLALAREGDDSQAITHYRQALALRPDGADTLNNLAWILATSPSDASRNGPEAVKLARRACELTGESDATYLDTLAAAYAESGRFEEAVEAEKKALALTRAVREGEAISVLEERLKQYTQRQPFRDVPPQPAR